MCFVKNILKLLVKFEINQENKFIRFLLNKIAVLLLKKSWKYIRNILVSLHIIFKDVVLESQEFYVKETQFELQQHSVVLQTNASQQEMQIKDRI